MKPTTTPSLCGEQEDTDINTYTHTYISSECNIQYVYNTAAFYPIQNVRQKSSLLLWHKAIDSHAGLNLDWNND